MISKLKLIAKKFSLLIKVEHDELFGDIYVFSSSLSSPEYLNSIYFVVPFVADYKLFFSNFSEEYIAMTSNTSFIISKYNHLNRIDRTVTISQVQELCNIFFRSLEEFGDYVGEYLV